LSAAPKIINFTCTTSATSQGAMPWEYADEDLAVLCEACHDRAHGLHDARPRPGARRRPPSPASTLLRLVVQHPSLARRVPTWVVPCDCDEGLALLAIIDLLSLGEPYPVRAGSAP